MSKNLDTPSYRTPITYDELPLVKFINHQFTRGSSFSFGLIVYCSETKRWFMVKRKHSIQILSLFWGNFYPTELPDLIFQMDDESVKIVENSLVSCENFRNNYREIASDIGNQNFEKLYQKLYRHRSLIELSIRKRCEKEFQQTDPNNWLWVKGQKDPKDTCDIKTAIREFLEESGLKDFPSCEILSQEIVVSNKFKNRDYIDTFWIAVFDEEFDIIPPNNEDIEVADRKWFTFDELLSNIQSSHIDTVNIALEQIQLSY